MQSLVDRKIPQSFGLTANQIEKLQDLSEKTGKSLSELARDAGDALFAVKGDPQIRMK